MNKKDTQMIKPRKLDNLGVAHLFLLVAVVVLVAVGGAYYVISSFADTAVKPKPDANTIRVATYNVLGAGYPQAPPHDRRFNVNTLKRADMVADYMKSNSVDIVGVQELDTVDHQFDKLKDRMDGTYKILPTIDNAAGRAGQRAILWDKTRFTAINDGTIDYPFQNAPYHSKSNRFEHNDNLNWVLLQDNQTNNRFYVVNVHMVARNTNACRYSCNPPGSRGGSDAAGAAKRKETADILADWIENHKGLHPVILLGDFNSPFGLKSTEKGVINRDEIPYCRLTRFSKGASITRNTWDTFAGRSGHCPYHSNKQVIDHVYATQRFAVTGWSRPANPTTKKASDHRPLIVDLLLSSNPKADATSETGGDADAQPDSYNLGSGSQDVLDQNVYPDDDADYYTD